jgi:hypothetical protein
MPSVQGFGEIGASEGVKNIQKDPAIILRLRFFHSHRLPVAALYAEGHQKANFRHHSQHCPGISSVHTNVASLVQRSHAIDSLLSDASPLAGKGFTNSYLSNAEPFLQAVCFILLVSIFCAADCLLYAFIMHIVECLRHLERTVPHTTEIGKKHSRLLLNQTRYAGAPVDEYRIYIQQHQYVLK